MWILMGNIEHPFANFGFSSYLLGFKCSIHLFKQDSELHWQLKQIAYVYILLSMAGKNSTSMWNWNKDGVI